MSSDHCPTAYATKQARVDAHATERISSVKMSLPSAFFGRLDGKKVRNSNINYSDVIPKLFDETIDCDL